MMEARLWPTGMIQTFHDQATEDVFYGEDSKRARKTFPKELWSVMRRKLDTLHAALTLADLAALPGNRLEALEGDREGSYSIRVNDKNRVTFGFENGTAFDVAIEDYH